MPTVAVPTLQACIAAPAPSLLLSHGKPDRRVTLGTVLSQLALAALASSTHQLLSHNPKMPSLSSAGIENILSSSSLPAWTPGDRIELPGPRSSGIQHPAFTYHLLSHNPMMPLLSPAGTETILSSSSPSTWSCWAWAEEEGMQ